MNLPFVLDIAIGLLFIYLILSLLASELQELLSTVLQWRAKHLRESIENLFAGEGQDAEENQTLNRHTQDLVRQIYRDPLLKNVNQEAKGFFAKGFRQITWIISSLYQRLCNKRSDFGDRRSGPSYIAPETFATTFMETLGLPTLLEKLVESRLEKFATKILEGIKRISEQAGWDLNQDQNFNLLVTDFTDIVHDFKNSEATLLTCIDRLSESLEIYIKSLPVEIGEASQYPLFSTRIRSFKSGLFGEKNARAILSGGLQPTLIEIADILDTTSRVHQEVHAAFADHDNATYQQIKDHLDRLPNSVKDSFAALARRAYIRKKQAENSVNQLQEEIAIWFDRSMSRASGVYKRNAKGVAILLGILIAIMANADMFHIFDRLSSDGNLRQIITSRASQIAPSPGRPPIASENLNQELKQIKEQTDAVLQDITLPLSWNPSNLTQQFRCDVGKPLSTNASTALIPTGEWAEFIQKCFPAQADATDAFIPQKVAQAAIGHPLAALRIILGWLLSGIAIAMGAPFWFDLLGKVMNVRNTGSKPASAASNDPAK